MTERIRQKCREYVAEESKHFDGSHDISHIDRVVKNTCGIFELMEPSNKSAIREEVLVAVASLHDSFDHKYYTTPEAVSEAKSRVSSMLEAECGFDQATVSLIIDVIDNMGFTAEVSRSAIHSDDAVRRAYLEIVQDADRLDAIGAVGIARCLAFTGAFGRRIISETGEDESRQRADFAKGVSVPVSRRGGSAIAHFYDKLVHLKGLLKTPAGRQIGEQRHQYILGFLDQFFSEIGLE
jgi:uncharacterized protein